MAELESDYKTAAALLNTLDTESQAAVVLDATAMLKEPLLVTKYDYKDALGTIEALTAGPPQGKEASAGLEQVPGRFAAGSKRLTRGIGAAAFNPAFGRGLTKIESGLRTAVGGAGHTLQGQAKAGMAGAGRAFQKREAAKAAGAGAPQTNEAPVETMVPAAAKPKYAKEPKRPTKPISEEAFRPVPTEVPVEEMPMLTTVPAAEEMPEAPKPAEKPERPARSTRKESFKPAFGKELTMIESELRTAVGGVGRTLQGQAKAGLAAGRTLQSQAKAGMAGAGRAVGDMAETVTVMASTKSVLVSLSIQDQTAELERISIGLDEDAFNAEQMRIVRDEIRALQHSIKGAPKPAEADTLAAMRNRRLAEVKQRLGLPH